MPKLPRRFPQTPHMADSSTATAAALFPFILLLLILFAGTSDAVAFHRGLYKDRLPRLGTAVSSSFHLCLTPGVLCKPGEHKLSRFERYKKIDIIKGGAVLTLNRRSLLPIRFLAGKGAASGPSADNGSTVAIVPAAGPSPSPSPSNKHNNRRHKRKVRNWIIGFFVGSVAGVLSGLAASVLFRVLLNCIRGRYRNLGGTEIFSPVFKNKDELAFLEKDDGLADLEVIGSGGSGEVYRKEITTPRGVKLIAIKKIRKHAADGVESLTGQDSRKLNKWMRQIQSEIRTVGRIRHRNLLPLIAHVSRPDCHFLIYEYMKNGSLHDALRDSAEGRREFNWPARHRIAMGVAAGLEHLHMHHQPRVVHRDLKPGNVLLDEDMEARISDFGLAKEIPDANTHMSTRNVAGTIGYIAPEYYQTMKYTTKCDIYSFGVILAAMVMGRFPSDSFFVDTEEMNLVKWMRNQLSTGNAAACFDEKIAGRGHDEQLELVLRVACFCSSDDPKERPSSKDVRVMLAQISNA